MPLIAYHLTLIPRLDLPIILLPTTTLYNSVPLKTMTYTKVTTRMTTGGPATRISLAQPVVSPPMDIQMQPMDASLDTQVCT